MGENMSEGCTLGNPRTERGPAVISVNLTCWVWHRGHGAVIWNRKLVNTTDYNNLHYLKDCVDDRSKFCRWKESWSVSLFQDDKIFLDFLEDRWSTKAQFCKHFADQKPVKSSDIWLPQIHQKVCFIMVGFEPFPIRNSM